MKRICIVLALLTLVMACTPSQADFPCRSRRVVAPCFTPTVCHEAVVVAPVVHHAAIITPTVTTIIQEPLPVFVFRFEGGSTYQSGSAIPPQQLPFQPPPVQAQASQGLALTDAQMDRIATMVAQKLSGSAAVAQNTMLLPPRLEEEPMQMSQAIVNDLGAKCASCHMQGTSVKGGLAIFDATRNLNPTKNGVPYATPERLWQRAQAGEMPPSATTDPSKRLNPETIAFLQKATER